MENPLQQWGNQATEQQTNHFCLLTPWNRWWFVTCDAPMYNPYQSVAHLTTTNYIPSVGSQWVPPHTQSTSQASNKATNIDWSCYSMLVACDGTRCLQNPMRCSLRIAASAASTVRCESKGTREPWQSCVETLGSDWYSNDWLTAVGTRE